ncbi:hypothetical protein DXG01_002541, partial [Tephrocybe rancida]
PRLHHPAPPIYNDAPHIFVRELSLKTTIRPTSKKTKASTGDAQLLLAHETEASSHTVATTAVLYVFANADDDSFSEVADVKAHRTLQWTQKHTTRGWRYEIGFKSGKGTESAYLRHVKNYVDFMVTSQAARVQEDPNWQVVPPLPITARNVAAFLGVETTRLKKSSDGQPIPGTRLGVEAIKQCISELENWRREHENIYEGNPEALRHLRDDDRIRAYEDSARSSERDRISDEQTSTARGTVAGKCYTYTREEIIRVSMWCFRFRGGAHNTHLGVRDRTMLLLSASVAFRGDNIRSLLLSDIYLQDVRLVELGPDVTAMALVCYSDQGKTKMSGRIDEQAAFRHRLPKLCPLYSPDRLSKHAFEWVRATTVGQEDQDLPFYTYWRPKEMSSPSIQQIWDEWTEASRRKKVITLIDTLKGRPNWNVERALTFLTSTYPIPTTSVPRLKNTHAFIDHLQKKDGVLMREILEKAGHYQHS